MKAEFTESDIVKKGYLMKRGSWIKSWSDCFFSNDSKISFLFSLLRKRRYFILRSDIRELCYYVSEDHLTLIGSIAIDSNTMIWNNAESEGTYLLTSTSAVSPLMELDANKNSFVVQWVAPPGSEKTNRQVMLKSEDAITMNEWLDAIGSEAVRTENVKQVDWWLELFGKVQSTFSTCLIKFRFVPLIPKLSVNQFVIETHPFHIKFALSQTS